MTRAEDLRAAADHIEKVGWYQGSMFPLFTDEHAGVPFEQRPCCGLGALAIVTELYPSGDSGETSPADPRPAEVIDAASERYNAASSVLHTRAYDHNRSLTGFATWNDAKTTTEEDVTAELRSAAIAAEVADQ